MICSCVNSVKIFDKKLFCSMHTNYRTKEKMKQTKNANSSVVRRTICCLYRCFDKEMSASTVKRDWWSELMYNYSWSAYWMNVNRGSICEYNCINFLMNLLQYEFLLWILYYRRIGKCCTLLHFYFVFRLKYDDIFVLCAGLSEVLALASLYYNENENIFYLNTERKIRDMTNFPFSYWNRISILDIIL